MISIFSKLFSVDTLPHKRNLWIVVIVTIFILTLNFISSVLCVALLFDNFKNNPKIFFAISIIDIAITIFTLVVESISTYVSDYMCDSYIKVVEKIKKNNASMNLISIDTVILDEPRTKYSKLKSITKFVRFFSVFICVICIISAILSDFSADLNFIKAIAIILSVISTFISMYQAFFSTVSCFMTGTYTSALFNMLYDYSKEIAHKYNDSNIQLSQKK